MSAPAYAKCSCSHCGLHIEFPIEAAGRRVPCPDCAQSTELILPVSESGSGSASAPSAAVLTAPAVLSAFGGPIPRPRISFLYRIGLVLVTLATVLLPVIYLAMIAAAAWGVYEWATEFRSLLFSRRGGIRLSWVRWVLYFGPLFIGIVLVLFMIKPLFARRAPRAQPLALNPGAEPLLFAFIAKICETVGAPFPKRIDLNCELNAAAGFRRGFWSMFGDDLVLTIGLPLVAGLSMRELAGVIAHEFGHFAQGFGMRLSYIVRSINFWFARVVHERDAWDLALAELAEAHEGTVSLFAGLARMAVWFSRLGLRLLMLVGHGLACFMLRQMEYDADRYEIQLAGSETFEAATHRVHVLGEMLTPTYKDLRTSWNMNRRLPDNFPEFLLQHVARVSPAQQTQWQDSMGLRATKMFDTHPSDGDRIRNARQANAPGVFHLDGPATSLFSQFSVPARQVTLLHYADDLGIEVGLATMVPVQPAT